MPVDSESKGVQDPAALSLFKSIGLDAKTAANAVANPKVTANLTNVVHEVATKFPTNALKHRADFCKYISNNQMKTVPQVEAALGFFALVGSDSYDVEEFETKCGVGVEDSPAEIKAAVSSVTNVNKDILLEERYRTNAGMLQ